MQIANSSMAKYGNAVCEIHGGKIVQIGSCHECPSKCSICETKACISSHEVNERIHRVITVE